jgi:hypothetical protein
VCASGSLFKKLWSKLLSGGDVESLMEAGGNSGADSASEANVRALLSEAEGRRRQPRRSGRTSRSAGRNTYCSWNRAIGRGTTSCPIARSLPNSDCTPRLTLAAHLQDNGEYDLAVIVRPRWGAVREYLFDGLTVEQAVDRFRQMSHRDMRRTAGRAREAEERELSRTD